MCLFEEREGVAGDNGVGGGVTAYDWTPTGPHTSPLPKDIIKQKCEEPAFDTSNLEYKRIRLK